MKDLMRLTMLEELLARWDDITSAQRHDLLEAQKIFVDDIARWYWSYPSDDLSPLTVAHAMPPFPYTWLEWDRPRQDDIWPGLKMSARELLPQTIGCLVLRDPPENGLVRVEFRIFTDEAFWKARWGPNPSRQFCGLDGSICESTGEIVDPTAFIGKEVPADLKEQWAWFIQTTAQICITSFAFLQCTNVEARSITLPETRARRRQQQPALRGLRYHHLVVEPIRRKASAEAGESDVSIVRALHICRGHFADYREGKGLFGKLHGVFWVDAHVRGDATAGEVRKTYELKKPLEG
jgi:hypothetical protein